MKLIKIPGLAVEANSIQAGTMGALF